MLEALVGGHVARVIARYDSVLYVSVCRRWTYGDAEAWVLALVWAQVLGRWGNLTTQHRHNCSSSLEVDLELASQALAVVLVEEAALALVVVSLLDRVDDGGQRQSLEEHSQRPTQALAGHLSLSDRP